MIDPVEIKKSSKVKIETIEKGTNADPIEIVPTYKSPKASKDEGFKNMTLDTRMPYRHPIYTGHQQTNRRQNKYERLSRDPTLLTRVQAWNPINIEAIAKQNHKRSN